ncbi:F-box/kelch-repeat protein At3g23880-like [Coffea arabica]|uniref:F-box/kelch-repeat protein At3g23880-like n=1 Tax=Coffea arabica TaxID=13443 RepID=A0ABM4VZD4_COFAR
MGSVKNCVVKRICQPLGRYDRTQPEDLAASSSSSVSSHHNILLCVSKSWRSLLSDPLFITAHLTLHLHYPQKLIFFSSSPVPLSSRSIYTLTFTTADNPGSEAVLQKLTLAENILENTSSKYASIVGSCNGLVLVLGFRMEIGFRDTMYLINPTTMEFVKLPASPLVREAIRIGGALGYDSSNDDYKIVTVSCDEPTSNETSS